VGVNGDSRLGLGTLVVVPDNRLAGETSPYLLQHASNPVDWYPWGPEALGRAASEDKPLFISIGYSACHWCHVMAHESFEDPEIAALINRSFVAIKIDREERPDLDQLYMTATQAATGHGGWPMTVFATPDGRPFFAGTYFPPLDRQGHPGFPRVLLALEDAWTTKRPEVETQADELTKAVETEARFVDALAAEATVGDVTFEAALNRLVGSLAERFDHEAGGFGPAPKFPRPSYIEACLVHHARTGDLSSLAMATTTLDAMAAGGIYDHLAGGFARYSVDGQWLVPHFEKMLTDQVLLARVYLHAYQVTGNADYAQVVTETLDFITAELGASHGGLASSIDADAGGREGSHAVFSRDEVTDALAGIAGALSPEEAWDLYSVTQEGTFEGGASVLARGRGATLRRTAAEEATRSALLGARRARVAPGIDDKVLVEWNAMAASVLAEASAALGVERWGSLATELVTLLDEGFRNEQGRLLRTGRAGVTAHLGFLGDHAWLLEAITRIYELGGDGLMLERASAVASEMIDLFFDGEPPTRSAPEQGGGFFTTGRDAEALLVRAKDLFDNALPSATSVAVVALARLAALTGDGDSFAVAERTVGIVDSMLERSPIAVPDLILAAGWIRAGLEIAAPGPGGDLLLAARSSYAPFTLVVHGSDDRCALLHDRQPGLAYLCRHRVCEAPTGDPEALVAQLAQAVRT